jgi:hypothetical protein
MDTIQLPYRPPGYLARQGYVKPLWEVKLRRSDTGQGYVPDDEAYNLPALSERLESDKYSVSTIDHVTVELIRTDELVDFLKGLREPKCLRIKIFSYLLFRKHQQQLVWFGQLQNLPEGVDAYPWDKLKLTFTSPPGAWEDGDKVKDADTDSVYRNKHVTDVVLPAFLTEARKKGMGGTREWKLEPPVVRGNAYFWSGLERPRKRLAVPTAPYDDTCRVTAMCWDSNKKVLYLGVHDGPGSRTPPWLVSYAPADREWRYVTRFEYTGKENFLRYNTGWAVQHLERSGNKLYFVCRTDSQEVLEREAHYKCRGEIDLHAIPRPDRGAVYARVGRVAVGHVQDIRARQRPRRDQGAPGERRHTVSIRRTATRDEIGARAVVATLGVRGPSTFRHPGGPPSACPRSGVGSVRVIPSKKPTLRGGVYVVIFAGPKTMKRVGTIYTERGDGGAPVGDRENLQVLGLWLENGHIPRAKMRPTAASERVRIGGLYASAPQDRAGMGERYDIIAGGR